MKTKNIMLTITIGLSLILVIGTVMFALNDNQGSNTNMSFFVTVLILMAITAVIAAVITKKRNDRKLKKLNDSYREVYEQSLLYIRGSNIGIRETKMVGEDLLELFHDAQVSGQDVHDFIGNDQKAFADEIVSSLGGRNSFWFHEIGGCQFFIMYLLVIKWVEDMETIHSFEAYLSNQVENSVVILFALMSFILIPLVAFTYIRAFVNKKMWLIPVSLIGFPAILIGLFVLFMRFIRNNMMAYTWVQWLVDGKTVIFDSALFVYSGITLIIILFFVKSWLRKFFLKKSLLA